MFWNVQGMSATYEGKAKARFIHGIAGRTMSHFGLLPRRFTVVLCEVTGAFRMGTTDLQQLAARGRRKATRRRRQLAYAVRHGQRTEGHAKAVTIDDFNALTGIDYGVATGRTGGNKFTSHGIRHVARVLMPQTWPGPRIYAWHANSSYKAQTLVPWVVAHLCNAGHPFVLMGDFNCEPKDLAWKPVEMVANINTRQIFDAGPTHLGSRLPKGGRPHTPMATLDYAICGNGAVIHNVIKLGFDLISRQWAFPWGLMPDHLPIMVMVGQC